MNQGAAYVFTQTTVGNFTLSAAPGSLTINPGGSGSVGTTMVTVTSTNGFTGSVSLSASGLPSGVTYSFSPTSTTTTSNFTLTASSSATAGTTTVTITGMSGGLTQNTTVAATVAQDFSVPGMLANPAAANPGQLTSTTMLISPASGNTFTSDVTIGACTGLPAGLSCTYSQNQIASGSNATTVTVSVQTAGPFTGTASGAAHRSQAQNQRRWLPLTVPLFGIVLVGLAGRGSRRRYAIVGLCLALAFTGFLVACGSSNSTPAPTVTVTPGSVNTLYPSLAGAPAQTKQFSATVSNSTNQTVTWAVTGTGNGSIDQTGMYTAPAALPNPNSPITITATSSVASSPGTATVSLQVPTAAFGGAVTVPVTEGTITHSPTFTLTIN